LPCSTNAAVVPEKYRSASCDAHAGNHAGRFERPAGRCRTVSGVIPENSTEIGFENRGRFLQLVAETGQVLQLAHRLLGLSHALGGGVDLAAEEVRILPVDRELGERLDL